MTGKRKQAKKRRRSPANPVKSVRWSAQRDALLQAARRAIDRKGPEISMDEIAAEAGITKPILYRHFGDRRGLAIALRDLVFGLVLGAPNDTPAKARQAARTRVAALYPVVDDAEHLRRVVVGFAAGFQMFVDLNRNLYRFLRMEGVLDEMWEEAGASNPEPVAESLAKSLHAIYRKQGIDAATAAIWAHALRGMVTGIVDWWTEEHACDRLEVERQFDLLAGAVIAGLGKALAGGPRARTVRRPRRQSAGTT